MIYLPAIVTVGHWFDKKRAFATGLAVCGTGVGTFIFAPLSHRLIQEYEWRGAHLIIAGIVLNCVVCGMIFRPLDKVKKVRRWVKKKFWGRRGLCECVSVHVSLYLCVCYYNCHVTR
jgi:predicted MFS family arabinose efflux permease